MHRRPPANPALKLIDIEQVAAVAHERGLTTGIDNTFATPMNQRPLTLGVDVVVHSPTRYLGRHGDLVAGAMIGSDWTVRRARWQTAKVLGGVISPHTAWLTSRGIKTLALRMRRQMQGSGRLVAFDVGGVAEGRRLVNGLRVCSLAVSLGDVATLVQHSASMTHRSVPVAKRRAAGISDGLVRLAVGLKAQPTSLRTWRRRFDSCELI